MRRTLLVVVTALISSFALTSTASAAVYEFEFSDAITVADVSSTSESVRVSTPGVITGVEVELNDVSHGYPADLDVMIETPTGGFFYLMSDNCGVEPIVNLDFLFADSFSSQLTGVSANCAAGGGFKPSNESNGAADSWSTAPGAVPASSFASLLGTNQTGDWTLHAADDFSSDSGSITGGFTVRLTTTDPVVTRIPSTDTYGIADILGKSVGGFTRTISDVDVLLNDLSHSYPDDMSMVLASPAGTQVEFLSNGCGSDGIGNADFRFDDEAPLAFPDGGPCGNSGHFAPARHSGENLNLAPGFPGPYAATLSAFDGQSPNGEWKLLIDDDGSGDVGYIGGFDLAITMRGAKTEAPSNPTFKFKKLGKKSIRATGRVSLAGEALTAGECAGSVKSTFQVKSVRKKGKKKITSYKKVVAVNSTLTDKAGVCGFDISAKLPKKYSGKRLRLVTNYLGGEFIAPFTGTTTEKVKKLKFR